MGIERRITRFLRKLIYMSKTKHNRSFLTMVLIALSFAMMVTGCLTSCKTVKNKQSKTVKVDSTSTTIAKNDIKEIEHTETTGDEWIEADTLSGDISDSTVIESSKQKIIISKGKVKAIAKKQKVNFKSTTTKYKTDNSVKAENKTATVETKETVKAKVVKPPFGTYAIGAAVLALVLYILYRAYKKYIA